MICLGFIVAISAGLTGTDTPPPVTIAVTAVHATRESRSAKQFDPGLESLRTALADLDFDTYKKIAARTASAPYGQETRFEMTPEYTLCVKPLSRERNGQVRISARIEMPPKQAGGKPIAAVSTTIAIDSGKLFRLGGLKLEKGELVVVIGIENAKGR